MISINVPYSISRGRHMFQIVSKSFRISELSVSEPKNYHPVFHESIIAQPYKRLTPLEHLNRCIKTSFFSSWRISFLEKLFSIGSMGFTF